MRDPGFVDLLSTTFSLMLQAAPPDTPALELWIKFKQQVKRMAVSWSEARKKDRTQQISEIQSQLSNPSLQFNERKQLRARMTELNEKAQRDNSIRSSTTYHADGDRPLSSFFAKIRKGSAYKAISALTLESGAVTSDEKEISEDVRAHLGPK